MALRIGDTAPNFQAQTTEGQVDFHQWIGDKWAVLFSHPKDFTPVCTTELGTMAKMKPEFDKRGVKVIGLSADPVDDHKRWANGSAPARARPTCIRWSARWSSTKSIIIRPTSARTTTRWMSSSRSPTDRKSVV